MCLCKYVTGMYTCVPVLLCTFDDTSKWQSGEIPILERAVNLAMLSWAHSAEEMRKSGSAFQSLMVCGKKLPLYFLGIRTCICWLFDKFKLLGIITSTPFFPQFVKWSSGTSFQSQLSACQVLMLSRLQAAGCNTQGLKVYGCSITLHIF